MRPTAELVIEFAEGIVTGANVSRIEERLSAYQNIDDQQKEKDSVTKFLVDLHYFRLGQNQPNWVKETDRLFFDILTYRVMGVFTTNPTQVAVDMLQRENAKLSEEVKRLQTDNEQMAALLKDQVEGKKVSYRT